MIRNTITKFLFAAVMLTTVGNMALAGTSNPCLVQAVNNPKLIVTLNPATGGLIDPLTGGTLSGLTPNNKPGFNIRANKNNIACTVTATAQWGALAGNTADAFQRNVGTQQMLVLANQTERPGAASNITNCATPNPANYTTTANAIGYVLTPVNYNGTAATYNNPGTPTNNYSFNAVTGGIKKFEATITGAVATDTFDFDTDLAGTYEAKMYLTSNEL